MKLKRTKTSCIFYGKMPNRAGDDPYCTLTTYKECIPDTCPWYKTQEMMAESYEKARQNYIKNHGEDKYYQLGFGPKRRCLARTVPGESKGGAEQ